MQIVIAIPGNEELLRYGGWKGALLREVAGVPLLIRIAATGVRAGADRALIVHGEDFSSSVKETLRASKLLKGLALEFAEAWQFDAASPESWRGICGLLEAEFYWLPWNWVTNKHGISGLQQVEGVLEGWDRPARLSRTAVVSRDRVSQAITAEGSAVTSQSSVRAAERWLVAHSGKPLDGIYSRFNRWLCRPLVRQLTHTPVTPNMVTFAGLLVAVASAYCFSKGTYWVSLCGALLFFTSGLLDEVDGMLARVRFSESVFGTWFEGSIDNLSYLLIFVGVTVGLYHERGSREVWLGGLTLVGAVLSIALISWQRGRITHAKRPNEYCGRMYELLEKDRANGISRVARQIEFLLKKGVFIHYVVIFTVLGLLPVLLRLAAFASNITWVLVIYFSYRFLRRQRTGVEAFDLSKAA